MTSTEEKLPETTREQGAPSTHLKKLRERIFARGVEKAGIPDAAVGYLSEIPIAEVRFVPLERHNVLSSRVFEDAGLQPAPLWTFVDQLPKRLDVRVAFKEMFGRNPAFVFQGADECLWIWHATLSGSHISRFPLQQIPGEVDKVWLVGYTPE